MAAIVPDNRSDKTIPNPRFGGDVAGLVRRVAKSVAQLPDGDIQARIKVDKGVFRPKTRVQVGPAYGLAGIFQERLENLSRLALQLEAYAMLAQTAAVRLELEGPEGVFGGHGLRKDRLLTACLCSCAPSRSRKLRRFNGLNVQNG
jgi:hypothetical protein